VPVADLEARVLGAIREQILVPEVVAQIIERTVEIVRERRVQSEVQTKRTRLAEVGREIERLVDLAARVEGIEEIAARLEVLRRERQALGSAIRAAEVEVDVETLRPEIERRLGDLGTALSASPAEGRRALRELLRGERLRVGPDAERGFRVAGTAWLSVPREREGARVAQDTGANRGW
jgi:hypothetical protein